MTPVENRDEKLDQLHVVVLGAEGQGGLLREVAQLDKRVYEVEGKVATMSGKWLILMVLLASLGQLGANILIRAFLR